MRKKKNNSLNMTQLFVLKHCSTGPQIFNKCAGSSFSEAVVGLNAGTEVYNNSWPALKKDGKSDKSTEQSYGCPGLFSSSSSQHYVTADEKVTSEVKNEVALANFPSLDGRKQKKGKKWASVSRFSEPSSVPVEASLVKVTRYSKKVGKPKRTDPIKIDIKSALEVGKCHQKKELKRLDPRRPRTGGLSISGNILDSANPVRKKGKVRPNKKKKLSSLRKMIERIRNIPSEERDIEAALCKQLDGVSLSSQQMHRLAQSNIHTSKFRQYCRNFASRELVESVKELVTKVRGFQDRMYHKDQVKARAKRRFAVGFHQCWKLLKSNSFKLIIMATNIERNEALFQKINDFISESTLQGVPLIFAGTCTDLSFWLFKKNRTCVVGIINFDGANDIYNKVMSIFERDRAEYEIKVSRIIEGDQQNGDDVEEELRLNLLEKLRTS